MNIFVSYARVDKPYCIRIIETLHAHEVWYDQRLYAGQDWWKEILRRLDWCDVFVYLLSPDSVASLYCRRELEIALRLKRDIIPVLIKRDTVLPEKMRDWQYVDLSERLTADNVAHLLNAILLVEREKTSTPTPAPAPGGTVKTDSVRSHVSPVELISNAVRALENGDYETAIRLLKQAQSSGYQSRFVRIDKLLRIAESAVAERKQNREVEREYQHIVALFNFESTRKMACEALAEFQSEFGDFDPRGLWRLCGAQLPANLASNSSANSKGTTSLRVPPTAQSAGRGSPARATDIRAQTQSVSRSPAEKSVGNPVVRQAPAVETPPRNPLADDDAAPMHAEILPMLQWCDISHGTVTLSSIVGADEDFGEVTEHVDNFVMSKYAVTNAQFAIFTNAEDGYRNPRWWEFSEHTKRWFNLGKGAAESRFNGDTHPRENVNWYEAMAFANWLGNQLKMKVTLPTVAQWQRAAKGDDDRYFPWGDEYHEEHCNTLETGLKATTPVDRYHKGISPYGVYDMAGNIWEWTLNTAAAADEGRDYRRAVAGGSFVSPCDRAQTSFRYYLDPRVRYSSIGIRLVGLT